MAGIPGFSTPKYSFNGKSVTKEELDRRLETIKRKIAEKYNPVADSVALTIKSNCDTQEQMIKALYAFLTQDCMKYKLGGINGK